MMCPSPNFLLPRTHASHAPLPRPQTSARLAPFLLWPRLALRCRTWACDGVVVRVGSSAGSNRSRRQVCSQPASSLGERVSEEEGKSDERGAGSSEQRLAASEQRATARETATPPPSSADRPNGRNGKTATQGRAKVTAALPPSISSTSEACPIVHPTPDYWFPPPWIGRRWSILGARSPKLRATKMKLQMGRVVDRDRCVRRRWRPSFHQQSGLAAPPSSSF